jgi:hypothetical protein
MAKNVLFLVHGMGFSLDEAAGDGAWHLGAERALHEAWSLFPTLAARPFEDYIELVPLTYDNVFRGYLSGVSSGAERVRAALGDKEYAKVAGTIAGADADEESFFWANAADVMLYRWGGDMFRSVHVELGKQIAERVRRAWALPSPSATQFSVLSHSLGTATVHGALNRLGGGRIAGSDALKLGGNFNIHCYVALANVSRLLFRGSGSMYDQTIIRPQLTGPRYVRKFLNVRHVADPISAPLRFAPRDWGPGYSQLDVRHLRDANVHALQHFLVNPRVSGALFRSLLPAQVLSQEEIDRVAADFRDVDIEPENKRKHVERTIDEIAQSLDKTFANDRNVLAGSVAWAADLLRLVWKNKQRLAAVLEAAT